MNFETKKLNLPTTKLQHQLVRQPMLVATAIEDWSKRSAPMRKGMGPRKSLKKLKHNFTVLKLNKTAYQFPG